MWGMLFNFASRWLSESVLFACVFYDPPARAAPNPYTSESVRSTKLFHALVLSMDGKNPYFLHRHVINP